MSHASQSRAWQSRRDPVAWRHRERDEWRGAVCVLASTTTRHICVRIAQSGCVCVRGGEGGRAWCTRRHEVGQLRFSVHTDFGSQLDRGALKVVQDAFGVDALWERWDATCCVERNRHLSSRLASVRSADRGKDGVVGDRDTVERGSSAQRRVPAHNTMHMHVDTHASMWWHTSTCVTVQGAIKQVLRQSDWYTNFVHILVHKKRGGGEGGDFVSGG
jgi:hypothetical protein